MRAPMEIVQVSRNVQLTAGSKSQHLLTRKNFGAITMSQKSSTQRESTDSGDI